MSELNTRRRALAADDPRHGTPNAYGNLGCRCDACRAANAASHREYMQRRGTVAKKPTKGAGLLLPGEIWLAIPGFEGLYEVSNLGRVRSLDRSRPHWRGKGNVFHAGQLLGQSVNPGGYSVLTLSKDGKYRRVQVHVLVLEAFVGPQPSPELEVCHGNGNPSDNRVDNLRWDTHSANVLDTVRHGKHNRASRTHCKHGHEFTTENTDMSNGWRQCKTCATERNKKVNLGLGSGWHNASKTHCKRNHEFTPENTYMRPTGRECKACRAVHEAARKPMVRAVA